YDTEYAMVDRDDDLLIGIRTSAITFGRFDVMAVMLSYGIHLILVGVVGYRYQLGVLFYLALVVAAMIAAYHYWLIRYRDRLRCFAAFRHNNWLGAAVFTGIVLG
nr:4-hydroxybenzoate octaprenyltransferase [Oxalobacteraceae bacterium]